jgi:hypothetical protein
VIASEHFPWLEKEKKIGVFLQNFFGKKRGPRTSGSDMKLSRAEFSKTNWVFEFLSEKYPISKKKSAETESMELKLSSF